MKSYRVRTMVRYQIVFLSLILLLLFGLILNVNSGSVSIAPSRIFYILFHGIKDGSIDSNIIWKIRLPRLLMTIVLGGALSISGYMLQTFFRNPIAGPFVLGISSGAKMLVGIVMVFVISKMGIMPSYIMIIASFLGSLLVMGVVLLFSRAMKSMSMLLVIGIMVGYICSAITDFTITFAKESDIANLTTWSMGSFSGASWDTLKIVTPIVLLVFILSICISKPMEAYQLGEGYATSMGINIKLFRVALILLSSLLSGCVTAFAGPISFVGIAVPHITKILLKTAKPLIVLPMTFLCGAVFCMFCDLIARTAFAPTELAIGTVTAFFGAPVVITLMIKRQKQRGV